MLRIVGSTLIIASSICYGLILSRDIRKRLEELKELKKIVFLLKGEIEYSICPVKEAFYNISKRCKGIFCDILENTAKDEELNLEKYIKERRKYLSLNEREILRFIELKECLCFIDKKTQLKRLELYLCELQKDIDDLEKAIPSKIRLYKCIPAFLGVMISIIII